MNSTWIDAPSDQDFIARSTQFLEAQIFAAITDRSQCIFGLSGGSTPKPIYAALGKLATIDWSKVWIFLVDDRHITPNHPDSNQHLVHTTLNADGRIAASQFIFPDTTLPHEECARDYDAKLQRLFADGPADITTLGMGDDGHIASLFPPLTDAAFGPALAIPTVTETFAVHDRISTTLPVLRDAGARLFLLKGDKKKSTWDDMKHSKDGPSRWPAKAILDERTTVIFCQ